MRVDLRIDLQSNIVVDISRLLDCSLSVQNTVLNTLLINHFHFVNYQICITLAQSRIPSQKPYEGGTYFTTTSSTSLTCYATYNFVLQAIQINNSYKDECYSNIVS